MRFNYSKGLTTVLFMVLFTTVAFAQSVITGTVVDGDNFPVAGASVNLVGSEDPTYTETNGTFTVTTQAGSGILEIVDVVNGTQEIPYTVADGETLDLGQIYLQGEGVTLDNIVVVGRGVIDLEEDRQTPVAVSTIFREEIQEKAQGNVEFPEIMENTPNVYVSNQAGGFGDSQMFVRGFDQTNTAFLLNGQPINGMEDGKMYWSNWSGMTDIANAVQVQRGLGSSKLAISSVGGTVNIVTKATEKKQGGRVQFVAGNDSYFKGTLSYDSGLMDNGWGISFAASHWQAHRSYAEGTRGQGQNYFLSIGKLMGNHNFNFLVTGAPQWHDQNYSKNEQAYGEAEMGKKFNNNIGFYENGEYQSLRRNYYHKPIANLNWDWEINPDMNLSTVIYASWGRGGGTGGYGTGYRNTDEGYLDWSAIEAYNASVVGPAQQTGGQNLPAGLEGNNIGYYYYNDFYDQVDTGATGDSNVDRERQRAGLVLRASVNNHSWYGGVTNFNYDINENLAFNVGADVRFYTGDHFRHIIDYLGLDGYYDNVGPAQRGIVTESFEANPWSALTDYADEDQRINYDYSEDINYQGVFGQLEYKADLFSAFFQGAVSNQSYQREDRYNFEGSQEGDKISKTGYNVKGGAAVNINEENVIFGNAGFYSRQPFLDNIYTGNYNDATELVSPEVDNEEITGFELGYKYGTRALGVNVNLYHTTWENRTVSRFFTNDAGTPNDFTDDFRQQNRARGVKQVHKGVEVDFNAEVNRRFDLNAYIAYGDWKYDGTESSEVINNDTGELISTSEGVDNSEVYVSNSPQVNAGVGFNFDVTNGLSLDSNFNYYGKNYRFVEFSDSKGAGMLPQYTSWDAGITYELKFGSQNFKIRGNVYNLLNTQPVTQSSKYRDEFQVYYAEGRTWNAGISYEF